LHILHNMDHPKSNPKQQNPSQPLATNHSNTLSTSSSADPIVYHYLTFDTELPTPSNLPSRPQSPNNGTTPSTASTPSLPPEPPNLYRYSNPLDWSSSRKEAIIWLSCVATMFTAYAAGCYEAGVAQMSEEWHVSEIAVTTGITIFTVGFAIAPMILAPLSEINGRRPLFLVTGGLFFVFVLVTAVTPTFAGMLVARFLQGCVSSTFSSTVGGVVADIYMPKERNTPMTLFTGSALFGTGLGPLVSGFIAAHTSWRW